MLNPLIGIIHLILFSKYTLQPKYGPEKLYKVRNFMSQKELEPCFSLLLLQMTMQ